MDNIFELFNKLLKLPKEHIHFALVQLMIQGKIDFLAINKVQLRQLRKAWVGDWEPNWKTSDIKAVIYFNYDKFQISGYIHINRTLSFPTEEMAFDFMTSFKDLLEQAKMLL